LSLSSILILIALISLAFVAVWGFLSIQRRSFRLQLQEAERELRDFVQQQQKRLAKLTPHALDYYHSLSHDASHDFARLNRIMGALNQRVDAVGKLLSEETDQCYAHAASIIHSPLTFSDSSVHRVLDEQPSPEIPMENLEIELEDLFQAVGTEIAVASERSEEVRIRCGVKRPTALSLMEAGIKYVNEQGKRLTGTFKMLVNNDESEQNPN
jgi:uncharacterized protein YoxC